MSKILVIGPEAASSGIAEALRRTLSVVVACAVNRRSGLSLLRREPFALVLLDVGLAAADQGGTELLLQNAGEAPLLEIDFAGVPKEHVVERARIALQRRAQDERRARERATADLAAELRSMLSGLLLESQLALREARPDQEPKLRHLVQMAGDLRDRLRA